MQALNLFCRKEVAGKISLDSSRMDGHSHLTGRQLRRRKGLRYCFASRCSCSLVCTSGTLAVYSRLGLGFPPRKKDSFRASSALTWALEEDATATSFDMKCTNFEGTEDDEVRHIKALDEVGTCDVNIARKDDAGKENVFGQGLGNGIKETEHSFGRKARVDVRELARNLWHAKTADDVEVVLGNTVEEELPPRVYSSMIKGLGTDTRLDAAFALVEWLKRKREENENFIGSPNVFMYNSLLGAVKRSGQFERAASVMEDMAIQDIQSNVVTYNTLMTIYIEKGNHYEAHSILSCMEEKGIYPSPATYSTALLVYQKIGDAKGALAFFQDLRGRFQRGAIFKVDGEDWEHEFVKLRNLTVRICYKVMREWLANGDNQASSCVLRLLTDMDRAQVSPGRLECEKLVWACTDESHHVVARELYNRLRDMGTGVSLSVCNHVIWLMGKAKKWWAALEIYEDLLDKGPKPNNLSYELIVSHFNILLSAARKRGIWRWGVRLINKMLDKGLKPGAKEWNSVLVACSKASECSAAVEVFKKMVDQGEKPTVVTYGALLSALEKGMLYDEALRVWDHMCKMGTKPNLYAYTILATVYIGKGRLEQVDSVIHDMISSGIEPTVVTFNAVISECARNHLGSAAFEWFHRMRIRNIVPNEVTYEMLIEALIRDSKPRLAYDMYLRAHNEGLILSPKAYDAVVRSCHIHGASIETDLLGPQPIDRKDITQPRKNSTESCKLEDMSSRDKPFDMHDIFHFPYQFK